MNKKTFGLVAVAMTVLMFIFSVLERSVFDAKVFATINPILFIATAVCGYMAFKDTISFSSKWTWVCLAIFFINTLSGILYLIIKVFSVKADILSLVTSLLGAAGSICIFVSVFNKKFIKIMPVGFGILILEIIIRLLTNDLADPGIMLLIVIVYALFALMALDSFPKANEWFKVFSLILTVLCVRGLGIYMAIALVVLAFLIMPGIKRVKVNPTMLAACLCVSIATGTLFVALDKDTLMLLYEETITSILFADAVTSIIACVLYCIATILVIAGLLSLAMCLFKDKQGSYGILSCVLMAVGSLLYMILSTYNAAVWSFDILNYPIYKFIISPYLWNIVVFAMFYVVFKNNNLKTVKFRIIAIIAAVITAILSVMLDMSNIAMTVLYSLTMIFISLLLVPCVFREYNSIAKHIFFTIITVGIWQFIWIYHVTKNLNKVSKVESRNPIKELLLCMFLPFYVVYWVLKTAEAVELYGYENDKHFKISVLCLAFMFVCPIFSTVIIQTKINEIIDKAE